MSAADEERLPPGGFSLGHGFPKWFETNGRLATPNEKLQNLIGPACDGFDPRPHPMSHATEADSPVTSFITREETQVHQEGNWCLVGHSDFTLPGIVEVLKYLKKSFEDEAMLDALPPDAAGNSGAWHAWRAYRKTAQVSSVAGNDQRIDRQKCFASVETKNTQSTSGWNWDGVWADRVKKGVEASVSAMALYGNTSGDDNVV